MKRIALLSILCFVCASFGVAQVTKKNAAKEITNNDILEKAVFSLTRVMMHDVVNPPAASRFYTYALLGAYELSAIHDKTLTPASRLVHEFKPLKTSFPANTDFELASILCVVQTGKLMLPSGFMIDEDEQKIMQLFRNKKYSQTVIDSSLQAAKMMTRHVITFAGSDAYSKLSAKLRYTPKKGDGYWYPTPPGYLEAVEPNWKTVRPMMIDSVAQFVPMPPVSFSWDSSSNFYRLAKEVYSAKIRLTPEQQQIAGFWDCNPFAIETAGHLSIGFKKISPGGHWINISGIAAKKARLSVQQTIVMQTMVSISLMDGFLVCWDEKYRSHRIRPETYINKQMDIRWQPLLQTPPFPEYPSGHSVVSSAAAEVLSYFLGDAFAYTDDSEMLFEIPARNFISFRQAAEEASISRLYGGIHFRDAIEQGQVQGRNVGALVVSRIRAAGIQPFTSR